MKNKQISCWYVYRVYFGMTCLQLRKAVSGQCNPRQIKPPQVCHPLGQMGSIKWPNFCKNLFFFVYCKLMNKNIKFLFNTFVARGRYLIEWPYFCKKRKTYAYLSITNLWIKILNYIISRYFPFSQCNIEFQVALFTQYKWHLVVYSDSLAPCDGFVASIPQIVIWTRNWYVWDAESGAQKYPRGCARVSGVNLDYENKHRYSWFCTIREYFITV